jgi:microcystin-dependent protein
MFGGNFAPVGWALCNGELLEIHRNVELFSILGTTYGGDGRTNFGLPDLRGRVPLHPGEGPGLTRRRLGEKAGQETAELQATVSGQGTGSAARPGEVGTMPPYTGINFIISLTGEYPRRPPRISGAETGSGSTPPLRDHHQQNETEESAPLATGLLAPSDLVVTDITATTLTLSWRDNSTREWGAAVYRMDPVVARRDPTKGWKLLTQVPEAVESNWAGTGMRSDSDFDLTPGTNYCYRVRAYVEFSMSEVSEYSKAVCIRTSDLPESTEQCSNESRRLCESRRATCEVEHARNGSSSDLCRWDSISSASACSETAGIWTTEGSRFSQNHPDAVPPGRDGACITQAANILNQRID